MLYETPNESFSEMFGITDERMEELQTGFVTGLEKREHMTTADALRVALEVAEDQQELAWLLTVCVTAFIMLGKEVKG